MGLNVENYFFCDVFDSLLSKPRYVIRLGNKYIDIHHDPTDEVIGDINEWNYVKNFLNIISYCEKELIMALEIDDKISFGLVLVGYQWKNYV